MRKHITALREQRNKAFDALDAMSELVANEDRLFTTEEKAAWDKGQAEVKDIGETIERLEAAEQQRAAGAQPAPSPLQPTPTPGTKVVAFKPWPGQGFVRFVGAMALHRNNVWAAAEYAKARWHNETPEVEAIFRAMIATGQTAGEVFHLQRAAVAAGTTASSTWAGPLVYAQNLTQEFIDLLLPMTIIGRLPLRPVPFNVSIPRMTGGAAAQWVGEGLSKPVSALAFDRVSIPWAKTSVISVITDELARFSDPSAEVLVRDNLADSIRLFLDQQFIDPSVAPSANLRPGAITNGAGVITRGSTGWTISAILLDVAYLLTQMAQANMPMARMFWLMNPATMIQLGIIRNAMDVFAFPEVAQGQFRGYPVIQSTTVPTATMILLDASEIFHASDPVIDIQASNEASLQMDNAPATPPTPLASMFQQNMIAIKAEQYQYWLRRRANSVGMITAIALPTAADLAANQPPLAQAA